MLYICQEYIITATTLWTNCLTFHASNFQRRRFAWNVTTCFLGKTRNKFSRPMLLCCLLQILPGMLSVKRNDGNQRETLNSDRGLWQAVYSVKFYFRIFTLGHVYSKTCVRQPPLKLTLVVDVERWLSYKGTCHVILLAKLHDMYLYKTDNFFHINHYLKFVSNFTVVDIAMSGTVDRK